MEGDGVVAVMLCWNLFIMESESRTGIECHGRAFLRVHNKIDTSTGIFIFIFDFKLLLTIFFVTTDYRIHTFYSVDILLHIVTNNSFTIDV